MPNLSNKENIYVYVNIHAFRYIDGSNNESYDSSMDTADPKYVTDGVYRFEL